MEGYQSFARFYDALMQDADNDGRALFYDGLIKKYSERETKTLLDLASGTGNLTFVFSRLGYDITAVDLSEAMLLRAFEKKLMFGDENVLLLCQDMTELDLNDTVDAAVCSLDGINHLTEYGDVLKTFERVSLFLNKGGVFVFDANTPYKHKKVLADNCFRFDLEELYCVWQNNLYADLVVGMELDFFLRRPDGGYERFSDFFEEKAYTTEELVSAGEKAGLEFIAAIDEKTEKEPTEKSERVYYIFRKR
jgi:SAM-dependent methyltransferase